MLEHGKEPTIIVARNLFDPRAMPVAIRDKLDALARTEDLRFSPDGRYLAIAGFANHEIALFEVETWDGHNERPIVLSRYTRIVSDCLKHPHGVDFITPEKLVVANRNGFGELFELPANPMANDTLHLSPITTFRKRSLAKKIKWPGSVVSIPTGENRATVLFCNNYIDLVSRHDVLLGSAKTEIVSNRVAATRKLGVPDGIALCPNSGAIAVSNHRKNTVVIYQSLEAMHPNALPDCILTRTDCPHGLRFTPDGQYLLVADAALPFVHIYARDSGWFGKKRPLAHVRIMDDRRFLAGHVNREEGGAKGLEIEAQGRFFLVTCELQPLAIFDLQEILTQL